MCPPSDVDVRPLNPETMLGAIIGDIVGSRFEFGAAPEKDFRLFTADCSYTDDTICTVAVADALMHGRDMKESLLDWCHRYPDPMGGYGNRFFHWLHSDNPQPMNSCGNGSAMRVSSVGWLFNDHKTILSEAQRTAEVTHNHPEGIKGAQCVANIIYGLRTCLVAKNELERFVNKHYGYEILPLRDIYKIGSEGHFDGTCQETVPMAVRCFLESDDFESAIRIAVMADGDTDTKAAICGSIAEGYYEIPEEMCNTAYTYLPDDMLDVLKEFYTRISNEI